MKKRMRKIGNYLVKCNEESTDKLMFIVGIIFFVCLLFVGGVSWLRDHFLPVPEQNCLFKELTGLYCPGCGGTRAVFYLFQGNLLKSLYYNPFSAYAAIVYIIYMGSWLLFYITKGKMKGLKFRLWLVFLGLTILLVQWVIKIVFVVFFNTYLI